jgi:hypothetical protein
MTTCHLPTRACSTASGISVADELHHLKHLLREDPVFAEALRCTDTTEEAAQLACHHGVAVTQEALWRHRGTLVRGGRPTWRG